MTQEFTVVAPEVWGDERFVKLSDDAKLLWLRLLTGPEVTIVPGLIVVGRAALAEAMKWSTRKLTRTFAEFNIVDERHPEPMAIADWDSRVVWLPRAFVHRRRPKNQNQVTAWRDSWRVIPECVLKRRAFCSIREFLASLGESFATEFDRIDDRIGVRNGPSSEPKLAKPAYTTSETNTSCSVKVPEEQTELIPRSRARARSYSLSSSLSSSLTVHDPTCQGSGPPESGGAPSGADAASTPPPSRPPAARPEGVPKGVIGMHRQLFVDAYVDAVRSVTGVAQWTMPPFGQRDLESLLANWCTGTDRRDPCEWIARTVRAFAETDPGGYEPSRVIRFLNNQATSAVRREGPLRRPGGPQTASRLPPLPPEPDDPEEPITPEQRAEDARFLAELAGPSLLREVSPEDLNRPRPPIRIQGDLGAEAIHGDARS